MSTPPVQDVVVFHRFAEKIMRGALHIHSSAGEGLFRALFGVSPNVCLLVWEQIHCNIPKGGRPIHLLWALLFLKVYATETVNRIITGTDEKTFRKWSWRFLNLMADMEVIRWEDRHEGGLRKEMVSVDGVDFRIWEPYPFDTKWYSHKFHGSGLRYELGVCIETGHVVWANGPFPCGSHSDLKIFQAKMKKHLYEEEVIIAVGGYQDERCKKLGETAKSTTFYSVIRARHETFNYEAIQCTRRAIPSSTSSSFSMLSRCGKYHSIDDSK